MEIIKASLMAAAGGGKSANLQHNPTLTTNGEHQPLQGYDGFDYVTVAVPVPTEITGEFSENGEYWSPSGRVWNHVIINVEYKPKEDATLKEITAVESDEQVVEPADGSNNYYPYIYLGAVPWPIPAGQDYENVGKRFDGLTQEYTVTPFIDIIDKTTGQSAEGYPKRVAPSASWSIFQGGYLRIDGWEMASDTSVKVYMTRYNTNYDHPESWNQGANVGRYLSDYVNGPFVIKEKL